MDDNPVTELQHKCAEMCAAIMRLMLPTHGDKLMTLACLVSAAVGDDEPVNLTEFSQLVESSSHNVVLDMYGLIDPHSAQFKRRIETPEMKEPVSARIIIEKIRWEGGC
jgi:hypothetical protein